MHGGTSAFATNTDTAWNLNLRSDFSLSFSFTVFLNGISHTHIRINVHHMTRCESYVALSSLWADVILVSEPAFYVLITAVPRAQTYSSSSALFLRTFLILQFPFNLFSLWLWLLTSFPHNLSEDKPHAISREKRSRKQKESWEEKKKKQH